MILRPLAATLLLAGLAFGTALPAGAQSNPPASPPASGQNDATGSTKSLSDKLESTDGVIRPPAGISPDIATKPPVPEPGTTPVIRPGSIPQQPSR